MRITHLLAAICVASALVVAGVALAANVNLKGGSSFTTGSATIKIDDVGSCSNGVSLDVEFSEAKRKFTAVDNEGRKFKGSYKQSGTDNRKLKRKFTSKSRKKLEKSVKGFVQACLDTDDVKVDLDNLKVIGKVNSAFDKLKVTIKSDVEGEADGEKGDATYKVKTSGALNLAPE